MKKISIIVLSVVCVGFSFFAEGGDREELTLVSWGKGVSFHPENNTEMELFYWFSEHNIFRAVKDEIHSMAGAQSLDISNNGKAADSKPNRSSGMQLSIVSTNGCLDMLLTVTNKSEHDWPEIAAIIPCLSPNLIRRENDTQPKVRMNGDGENFVPTKFSTPNMVNNNTFIVTSNGLQQLHLRELHYCDSYREEMDIELNGEALKDNWPLNEENFSKGVMIRESTDGVYVVGMAWEEAISVQGHNPYCCMHLSIRVGGLAPGESKTIRGKTYLFKGTKEDCMSLLDADFEYWAANPVE